MSELFLLASLAFAIILNNVGICCAANLIPDPGFKLSTCNSNLFSTRVGGKVRLKAGGLLTGTT